MAPTISDLPEEMLVEVLKFLDGNSVKEAVLACKEWNRVISTSPAIMKKFHLTICQFLFYPKSCERSLELMSLQRHFNRAHIATCNSIAESRLMEVSERFCSRLTELEFSFSPWDKPWAKPHQMLKVLQRSPNLEKLSLQLLNTCQSERVEIPKDKVLMKKLKKLEDKGNLDFYSLIEAPELRELKIRHDFYPTYPKLPFKFLENFLKASSKLECLEMNFADLAGMKPEFPFQLKKLVASCRFELNVNIEKFLTTQAATVQTLEAECDNSEIHELVLTSFKQLRTLKANLDKLTASQNFFSALMPMPSLSEISSLRGFSSKLSMQGVLGNCPVLKKLECKEDRELPDRLEFVAEHSEKLEVLGISTVRETFGKFQCLKKLIVLTVESTGHLVLFLKMNPTVKILDIQWLSEDARRRLNISLIVTETTLERLKMNGSKADIEAVGNQITSKCGDWTKFKLSDNSGSLQVDIIREKRPCGTRRGHSSTMK